MAHLVQHQYIRLYSISLGTCFKHYSFLSSRYTRVYSSALKNVTFGGSGGVMTTARTELPYPCIVPRPRLGTSLHGGGSNVTG